ncbi:MAG: proline--tRNA ligase [Myxococcales bacterium]|nr:proline--tRNA ligase [Myxococcales bacterium]
MRASRFLAPTLKEAPQAAVVQSHQLMLRTGMIRQVAAGIYNVLPLGLRTLRKVETIVREEMNRAEALELTMPVVIPGQLWQESGRWDYYGAELLRFTDRKQGDFCLGPTHEEVITSLAASEIKSYRQLPMNLYQIQTKFRDEVRPRFGLMRGREFVMKDAYSFDKNADDAQASYWRMHEAYTRIFKRCGLDFRAVEADTGNIGGSLSHEFQVIADSGEDAIAVCERCGYAANVEKAELRASETQVCADVSIDEHLTPEKGSIESVCQHLGIEAKAMIKCVAMMGDGEPVLALVRGDHDLSEPKLRALLGVDLLVPATEQEIADRFDSVPGFIGPQGRPADLQIVADHGVAAMGHGVTGANRKDYHVSGLCHGRDFDAQFADVRQPVESDGCGRCGSGRFRFRRGIEVGHIFYLGTKYSEAMNATVLDENGKAVPLEMGCYGIGIGRTAAAAIEQSHDHQGIVWPVPLAPFEVHLLRLGKEAEVSERCDALYESLLAGGLEVLYDDRNERPGFKFKDAELIGCPWRVALGRRGLEAGQVEVVNRSTGERSDMDFGDLVSFLCGEILPARNPLL